MFTSGHFIWLGVIAVLITAFMIVIKKCNVSQNFVQKTVFYLLIVLKLLHVSLSMKETGDGGYVLNQTQLSFHLCSIMIYTVFLINIVKNEKFIKTMKSFMVPAMLIGAAMALLIPTEGVDPSRARVWQYMLIHGVLVFYGLYLMVIEKVDLSFKAYLSNLKILTLITVLAFIMNSILEQYKTNFLFLRKPPMDNLPILNLNNGWYVYFITLTFIACTLIFLVHLPFIIKRAKGNKLKN
ncbi:MAG: YwaF family protein [Clostridia bacterium]|nr:YwaF family protein [Clostridia bacterium]